MVPNSPQIVVQGQFQWGFLHGHYHLGSARPSFLWVQGSEGTDLSAAGFSGAAVLPERNSGPKIPPRAPEPGGDAPGTKPLSFRQQ